MSIRDFPSLQGKTRNDERPGPFHAVPWIQSNKQQDYTARIDSKKNYYAYLQLYYYLKNNQYYSRILLFKNIQVRTSKNYYVYPKNPMNYSTKPAQ